MTASQQDKNLCFKLLKKAYPELHSSILCEVKKGYSSEDLNQVREVKQMFDKAAITDRRLFVAVVFKVFHPALYNNDNRDIPLIRGLNKIIAEQLFLNESNTTVLIQQVRTWLKFGIDDLRQNADAFYAENFKDGNEEKN